ncbi:hypothetical protein Goshw_015122, partial [Gossypium schwendimanii]|nr:hypothetical protein [Gossypium schwendimanii]
MYMLPGSCMSLMLLLPQKDIPVTEFFMFPYLLSNRALMQSLAVPRGGLLLLFFILLQSELGCLFYVCVIVKVFYSNERSVLYDLKLQECCPACKSENHEETWSMAGPPHTTELPNSDSNIFLLCLLNLNSIRSIICLNLPSFSGGLNPWGTPSGRKKNEVNDGLLEVVGFRDAWHGLVLLAPKGHGTRLAQ